MLRRPLPRAAYVLLEDPDVHARARSDPRASLEELRLPALFDEIRNVPELLAHIRTRIDRNPRQMGRWLFTGSQEAPLMRGVAESMAGPAAILRLPPFSLAETDRVSLLHGGYPEVLARPTGRGLWFGSYIRTYLERDVRAVTNVRDLATFRPFVALRASRQGRISSKIDLGCRGSMERKTGLGLTPAFARSILWQHGASRAHAERRVAHARHRGTENSCETGSERPPSGNA